MEKNNVVAYYDDLAKDYDNDRFNNSYGRFIDTAEKQIIQTFLAKHSPKTPPVIIDLPCGTGRLMEFATIGIDASNEMLKVAQQKYPTKTFYQADAEKLPLADNSIDVILSFHLFMHLDPQKIERIFAEFYRVLKADGRVIFDIPSQKRRKLGKRKNLSNDWHGSQAMSSDDVVSIASFEIVQSQGVLWLPIHRLPKPLRRFFQGVDKNLANSPLKELSSYLVFELKKTDLKKANYP